MTTVTTALGDAIYGIEVILPSQMNQTRVEWSTFGCAKIYTLRDDFAVWIYAAIMVILTFAFYVAARFSQNPKDEMIIEGRCRSFVGIIDRLESSIEIVFLTATVHSREHTSIPHVEIIRK